MGFRHTIGDASQALDINEQLGQLAGYGLVDGGEPSTGARPFAVDFLRATAIVNGETVELPATSVDLDEYTPDEYPRKAVIYIGLDEDGEGEYRVAAGKEKKPKPEGATRFDTYEPSPPDLRSIEATPVVEVWLGGPTQPVTVDDIRDRRLTSLLTAHHLQAERAEIDALIDGAGVRHEDALGPAGKDWDDVDILEAINTDPNHGTDAPHTYFSGSHADLANVSAGQHHTRRGPADFRAAMTGLDAADLSGHLAEVPGMHLEIPDGVDPQWTEPPMAEASVIDSGTVTHTGGSTTVVTLEGVAPTPEYALELSTGVSVEQAPGWNADYGYSTTTIYRWDEAAEHVDVDLSIEWDIDPGAGNDLELRYRVIDMSERGVTGLYGPDDVFAAVEGASLSLSELLVSDRLSAQARDSLPDTASAEIGETVVVSGNGVENFGSYVFDGSTWTGPYAAGLTSLSELVVDTAADWAGNRIANVGAPTSSSAVIRPQDISDHADDAAAHHAPVTGADLDHANIQNVQPNQHHPEPTPEIIGETVAGEAFTLPFTAAAIPSGSSSRIHVRVASNEEFVLVRGECYNQFGNSPSGLRLQVRDHRSSSVPYSQSAIQATGTMSSPLVTVPGPIHLEIRVNNGTGEKQVAGGLAAYVIR